MFDLRLINHVPLQQAAPLSFVESPAVNVRDNVSLVDFASERPSNSGEFYHTQGYLRVIPASSNQPNPSTNDPQPLVTDEFVLGNRATLSQGVTHAPQLFYRSYIGRGPMIYLEATGADVTFNINAVSITFNSTGIGHFGRSARYVVKKINDAADGLKAQLLYAGDANFDVTSQPFTITDSGFNLYASSYRKVYASNASTTDLEAARETIKASIDVLVDGKKTTQLSWDLWVDSYDTDGFICELYVDRRNFQGKTFQVRYNSIDSDGVKEPQRVEVINPEPYLVQDIQYTLKDQGGVLEVRGLGNDEYLWAIGLFSKTGANQTVTVDGERLTFGNTEVRYPDKSVAELVSEINETLGATVLATVLYDHAGILSGLSLVQDVYTIRPSGTALPLQRDVGVLFSPDSRLHPKLPHDTDIHVPWYPRVSKGSFAEDHGLTDVGYGDDYGQEYGGSPTEKYVYGVPEYATQIFGSDLGAPYRHVTGEEPTVVEEKILRTRRSPLESLVNLTLRDGSTDISSRIVDVDLEQGFLFLNAALSRYNDLNVDYMYAERSLIYKEIDLNPVDNQWLIGKFVSLYAIPERIGVNTWRTPRTIYHVISDTLEYTKTQLASLTLMAGIKARPVLLGAYQVVPTSEPNDVVFRSVPIRGGGLHEDEQAEKDANFCWDVGRWDGEPFEAQGAVVVEVPSSVIADPSDSPPFVYNTLTSSNPFMDPTRQWTVPDIEAVGERWTAAGTAVIVNTGT